MRGVFILILLITVNDAARSAGVSGPQLFAQPNSEGSFVLDAQGVIYWWGFYDTGVIITNSEGHAMQGFSQYWPLSLAFPASVMRWESLASDGPFSFALGDDGELYAWGNNGNGSLGIGNNIPSSGVVRVLRPASVGRWAAVWSSGLALGDDGNLYAWGYGSEGRIGDGNFTDRYVPTRVIRPTGVTRWVTAATGRWHSMALGDNGQLYCWGRGVEGQLGNGTLTRVASPVPVSLPPGGWIQIACGTFHCFALNQSGTLYSWGMNYSGGLGHGDGGNPLLQPNPKVVVRPAGVNGWRQVTGGNSHSLAIGDDGELYGWGYNEQGQCGVGHFNVTVQLPTRVLRPDPVSAWVQITGAGNHTLALGDDCRLYAWGWNQNGQLGNGPIPDQPRPLVVTNLNRLCVTNRPPTIAITSPTNGAVFLTGTNVEIREAPSDIDGAISKVEFFQGATKLGEATMLPYSFIWSNPPPGNYALTAKATDNGGLMSTSAPVTIIIRSDCQIEVYRNDFESAVGPEWSLNNTENTPIGSRRFLGRFPNVILGLSLTNLPQHSRVTVCFDLFVCSSWDGNHTTLGPDIWDLSVDGGPALFHTTFNNHPGGLQAFPDSFPIGIYPSFNGAVETNSLGFLHPSGVGPQDAVYRVNSTFSHQSSSLKLNFSSSCNYHLASEQGIIDESWGLDNIVVSVDSGRPPQIVIQPTGATRCPGQSITFSVSASGTGPFSYQWRKGGTNISGAINSSYTITSVASADAGSYDVIVTGACGSVTSTTATLSVNRLVFGFGGHTIACAGTDVTWNADPAGLSYQWRKDGVAIVGATNASYTIKNVTTTNAGTYEAVITGPCNGATNTEVLEVGCNLPPTVSITSPTSGAVYLAGTNIEIRVTANDPDGTVSKVEFFQGVTKLGEDATLPYSFVWSNPPPGNYTLLARATDNQGATATSVPVNVVVILPTNRPPSVRITRPADRTIFQVGEPIIIEAAASDPEGPVQRVEFYSGTIKLGESTSSPFRLTWLDAAIGDYALTARAVDQGGSVGVSQPVRIAVSDACGQVAIVRSGDDPEFDKLQDYLYELGVKTAVVNLGEASVTNLLLFDLVVEAFGTNGPSNSAVELFAQQALRGRALYFIGDALVNDTPQLTDTNRSRWTDLIHLQSKTSGSVGAQVEIDLATMHDVILNGKVGTVQNFNYAFERGVSTNLGVTGETVLASAGDSDVLVAFQDFTVGGLGRTLTQTFRVASGTNEVSLAERKRLFQNAVWWLLNCRRCANLNVKPEDSASPTSVMVGETFSYKLLARHNGACEALAVIVASVLPPGMEFKEARTQRGQARYSEGLVTFEVGRITSGATNEMEIVVRPTFPGLLTNAITLRSLNEETGALADNRIEIVTEVLPALTLQITNPLTGPVRIVMAGPAGRTNVLEVSTNLSDWSPVSTNELIDGSAVFADPQSVTTRQRMYRGRLR